LLARHSFSEGGVILLPAAGCLFQVVVFQP